MYFYCFSGWAVFQEFISKIFVWKISIVIIVLSTLHILTGVKYLKQINMICVLQDNYIIKWF